MLELAIYVTGTVLAWHAYGPIFKSVAPFEKGVQEKDMFKIQLRLKG